MAGYLGIRYVRIKLFFLLHMETEKIVIVKAHVISHARKKMKKPFSYSHAESLSPPPFNHSFSKT